MDRKNVKFKKTDEGKKTARLKKGGRYNCHICGMEVSVYESCECLEAIELSCCDKRMIFS